MMIPKTYYVLGKLEIQVIHHLQVLMATVHNFVTQWLLCGYMSA